MKLFKLSPLVVTLAACAPVADEICDREAVAWDKWDTPELTGECADDEKALGRTIFPDSSGGTRVLVVDPSGDPDDGGHPDSPTDDVDPTGGGNKGRGNNGWGNGSQDAPGASGPRNNAENGPKGKNDGRGKASGNSGNGKASGKGREK